MKYQYVNTSETKIYKQYYNLVDYWRSESGNEWLEHRLATDDWIIHVMILELENIRLSFFKCILSNPDVLSAASAGTDNIPGDKLKVAIIGTCDIYSQIVSSSNGASGNYCVIP